MGWASDAAEAQNHGRESFVPVRAVAWLERSVEILGFQNVSAMGYVCNLSDSRLEPD